MHTEFERAKQIVTDNNASASVRRLAWIVLKSATGKPVKQIRKGYP